MTSNARVLLRAWESTQAVPQWQRPAAILSALSGLPLAEALGRGVARRDAALLAWRTTLFGTNWQAFAQCPQCAVMLEYELPPFGDPGENSTASEDDLEVEFMGRSWSVRWPSTRDIHEASTCSDRSAARTTLLRRMLPGDVDPDTETGAAILAAASNAHFGLMTLDLQCCACPCAWTVVFDPGEFLWREMRAAAHCVLREVDVIARVYHWSEDQILALSDVRRREYLQMVQ